MESDWQPQREREYMLYRLWRNLPLVMRTMSDVELDALNINNEDLLELLKIKTQSEFGTKFSVHIDTLTDWNQKPVPKKYKDIDWRIWAKELTKDVMFFLYEGIQKEKDAARIKLWLQSVDDFSEKSQVDHNLNEKTIESIKLLIDSVNARRTNPTSLPSVPESSS